MATGKSIALNLHDAPLIVGFQAIDTNSSIDIDWPAAVAYADVKLPKSIQTDVNDKLDWIKRQYQALVKNPKTRSYAPHVAPYLTQADLRITATKQTISRQIGLLNDLPLDYAQNLAKSLSQNLGDKAKHKTKPLASEPNSVIKSDDTRVRLLKAEPINDLEVGFEPYYRASNLSWPEAYERWLEINYTEKIKYLEVATKQGSIDVKYLLEAVLEPELLRSGQDQGMFEVVSLQSPSPVHGYALPKKLVDGGMIEKCFDLSYELYSQVSEHSLPAAGLMCLWGHRQRAVIRLQARNLIKCKKVRSRRLKKLADILLEKLQITHPHLVGMLGVTAEGEKEG